MKAYHAVLGAFYNIPIEFGDFEQDSMINILTNAMVIIKLAEYLQCVRHSVFTLITQI